MSVSHELASALHYLRRRYKVSEPDLLAIAKKLQKEEDFEENWDEIVQKSLKNRRKRR